MVNGNKLALVLLSADRQTENRNNSVLPRLTEPSIVFEMQDHVLIIGGNGITNTTSIDRAKPVGLNAAIVFLTNLHLEIIL